MRRRPFRLLVLVGAAVALPLGSAMAVAAPSPQVSPAPGTDRGGQPERAERTERTQRAAVAASAAVEAWGTRHPERYAGLTVDGARLVVRVARPADGATTHIVRGLVPGAIRGRVAVVPVERSMAELAARQQTVADTLDAARRLTGLASAGTAIDVRRNDVTVWAPGDPAPVTRLLRRTVGLDGLRIVGHAGRVDDQVDKDDPLGFSLVEGGQKLDLPSGDSSCVYSLFGGSCTRSGYCTSGFAVQSKVYGKFLLTAGHCGKVGDRVHQGGMRVGQIAAKQSGGLYDVALVATTSRNQIGRVHVTSSRWFEPVDFAIGLDGDPIGATVCHSGVRTTGVSGDWGQRSRCGTILARTYRPPSTLCPDAPCAPVFRLTSYAHAAGDSGAPVYWNTIFGRGALGIHKGSGPNGEGVYSSLPYVMKDFGLTLTPAR